MSSSIRNHNLPFCPRCTHYYVTHDKTRPYGCRAMGFTSKKNPAEVVYANSGIRCQRYQPKPSENATTKMRENHDSKQGNQGRSSIEIIV